MPTNGIVLIIGDNGELTHALSHRGFNVRNRPWSDAAHESSTADISVLLFLAPRKVIPSEPISLIAFRWLQAASKSIRSASQRSGALLAAVVCRGGHFGVEPSPIGEPEVAGLAGLIKTAQREWPEVNCKVIDIDASVRNEHLVDELLRVGPIEVGFRGQDASALELVETAQPQSTGRKLLGIDDLVVVSGGARGVTAAAAIELARRFQPALLLLGRSDIPKGEPAYIASARTEIELKQTILANWRGGRPTPRQVEHDAKRILAERDIRSTLDAIHAAGARADYRAVDIRNADEVAEVLVDARAKFGPVRGIVHGSGVIADRRIEAKTEEQFRAVYETKVDGLRSLLAATTNDPLKVVALFSSTTARFGRVGQSDYAAANEVLNATAHDITIQRPDCKVVSFNWGPWDGGMVTPALRNLFAAESVGVIPVDEGARFFVDELVSDSSAIEVIVLGQPPQVRPSEQHDVAPPSPIVFRRDLDVARCPVLQSHVLAGRAVFPIALALEWLAHAAMLRHPGLGFCGCDELRVLHPLAVALDSKAEVALRVGPSVRTDNLTIVPVELHGPRNNSLGICFRAKIVLGKLEGSAAVIDGSMPVEPYPLDLDDAYAEQLFHGPELRGLESITGVGPTGIGVIAAHAPAPGAWFADPLRTQWLAEPLVIDSALQAMILWGWQNRKLPSLPCGWESYQQFLPFRSSPTAIHVHVSRGDSMMPRADIEFIATDGALIARITGCEYVLNANLRQAFRNPAPGSVI